MKRENFIKACVYMVVGILLCLSIINVDTLLSWFVSISLLVVGAALLVFSLYLFNTLISTDGITGALLIAAGVYFLPPVVGFNFTAIISMILMVLGAAFMVDGIYRICVFKKRDIGINIAILLIGAACFAFGICLWLIAEFRQYAGLILGIFLIVYSVLLFVALATNKTIIVVKTKKK